MSDSYPIVEVQPEWVLEPEEMGSKTKFWYRKPEDAVDWLFKYPQDNTGQHWAEKIAAEVASRLGIIHAKVELAEFQGKQGSVTESFARGGRELVRQAVRFYPALFRPALVKLEKLDESSMSDLVNRVPANWMTPSARAFALALMRYNLEQLGGLI